jgi:uncharacterized protein YndB with AHSA1/START domain
MASCRMGSFSFFSLWVVRSPIDEVWNVVSKGEDYPIWWPYVERATKISEGDDTGVGQVVRSKWSTALPYGFEFETEAIRVEEPSLLELESQGQLEGSGTWELSTTPEGTAVRYFWRVRTTQAWMDLLGPIARPGFAWNHAVIMRAGGEGLAKCLATTLVRNESFTGESAGPAGAFITIMALVIAIVWLPLSLIRKATRRRN